VEGDNPQPDTGCCNFSRQAWVPDQMSLRLQNSRTINGVSYDGMTNLGAVDANLMGATGFLTLSASGV